MERIVFLDREALLTDLRPPAFAHHWVEYSTTATEVKLLAPWTR